MVVIQSSRGVDNRNLERIKHLVISSPALTILAEWWATVVNGKTITETTDATLTMEEVWVLSDGVQLPLLKLLIEQIPHQTERWVHTDSHPILPQDWMSLRHQSHFHLPSDFDLKTLDPNTTAILSSRPHW